jgi:hypothetical protein
MYIVREKKTLRQETTDKFNSWKTEDWTLTDRTGIITVDGWTQERFMNVARKLDLDVGFFLITDSKEEADRMVGRNGNYVVIGYYDVYEPKVEETVVKSTQNRKGKVKKR